MSETIDFRINIDAKNAVTQIDTLTGSLKEVDKKSQEFVAREKQRIKTLREEYRELRKVHEQLHANILSGNATNRTKYQVGDQGKFTIKQLRERINLVKALMDVEQQNIRKSSFAKAKSDYAKNIKAIAEGRKLLRQIEDRSSDAAKKLSSDVANATRRNSSIEKRWGGYEDFGNYKQNLLNDIRRRTTLGEAKRQAVEEERNYAQELKKKVEREAEFITTLKARYKEYFNERIALEEKLKKVRDKNSPEYAKGKDRLDTLNREMKNIEYARWGNKSFQDFHQNTQEKYGNKTVVKGLDRQIKSEAASYQSLSQRISDVKTKMGQLAYAYKKGNLKQVHYTTGIKNLKKEYALLKKATDEVNSTMGHTAFSTFGKNIRSHLHWLVSGALVDRLMEIPMAIKDIAVEFDNLERKITQNIELSGQFENNHEALAKTSKDLVYSSLDIANYHGMKVEEVLEMMQIMSRRFKDPAELKYFTNLAATMSKLDFVEPKVAAETLEAVILSFGLTARQAADFVNEFSIATHTMRINGQDLLEALQRSAPMLKAFGMSTAESVAMVSTLSTTLGREGKYIGNAITGMFSRLLRSKNQKFFNDLGISFEDANGNAKEGIGLMREYLAHYRTLTEHARRAEVDKIFGTYRVVPGMANFDTFELFEKSLAEIEGKASDATTAKLEREQRYSYESKINRFNNSLHMLAYVLSDEFAPAVGQVLDGISRIVLSLVDFIKNHKESVEILGKFIAVCAIASIALNVISKGMSFAAASTSAFNTILKAINMVIGYNTTLLTAQEIQTKNNAIAADAGAAANTRFGNSFVSLSSKIGFVIKRFAMAAYAITLVMGLMDAIATKVNLDERRGLIHNYVEEEYGGFDKIPDDDPKKEMLLRFRDADKDYNESYVTRAKLEENGVYLDGKSSEDIYTNLDSVANDLNGQISEEKYFKKLAESIDLNTPLLDRFPTGDTPAADETDKSGDNSDREARNKERREKSVLNALASQYKTQAELSQKRYDSLMGDINFDQEIFGKSPQNVSRGSYTKMGRQAELRNQIRERDLFIEKLRKDFDNKIGDLAYAPSANFNALQDEMKKSIGQMYDSTGSYVRQMLAKVGVVLNSDDVEKQVQEFKDKNKFFTNISKLRLGDTVYWNGSEDKGNKAINYTGTYMGNNAVQFAGENGAMIVPLNSIKGIRGFGSTGVGTLKAEDLDALGEDNPQANILSEILKKIAEFEKLNESEREKIKELSRELKRGYMISPEKAFEERKSRLKTEEEIDAINHTDRRNAYNSMVLTNRKIEYEKQSLVILQEEYQKAIEDRMKWMEELARLNEKSIDEMTEDELEAHDAAVKIAERELELAKDTEAQKLLSVKKTNDEIEKLEYQRTQKIREGLHGVVHDLLLEGKSWKDVWSELWSDLADEALRALMGIENGQQSTLGAIAAKAFGLDKENPNGELNPQTESVNTNTSAMDRNTAAITNLTNTLGSGQGSQGETQNVTSITQSVADAVEDAAPKWADEMDSMDSAELARKESKTKDAMQMLTALGIVGAAASMSGSKKMQKLGAILSIGTSVYGRGKGKKMSHSGSIVGVTPLATRYYHSGGNVGTAVTPFLKSDEVNAVLQTGEEVVSRKDRRSNEIMSEQNKYMADAMERIAGSANTNVTFAIQAIDAKSVAQLLRDNGDVIMNILRQQSAYGNGRI